MIKIWTGPIRTGKTTHLQSVYDQQRSIGGFLTPDQSNVRMLYDIQLKRFYEFETQKDDIEVVSIGRFKFSKASFDLAVKRMKHQAHDPKIKVIAIDEIGKLELKGEGFYDVFVDLLSSEKDLHLVVRDYLHNEVIELIRSLGYTGKIVSETISAQN